MSVGSSLGGVIGGAIGLIGGGDGGQGTRERAAFLFEQLQDPNFDFSTLTPRDLQIIGQFSPETLQAIEGPVAKTAEADAGLKESQKRVLEQILGISQEGFNITDRAAQAKIQGDQARANRGQQEAILADQRARGGGGSGSELAARLIAQQSSADRASNEGLNLEAQRQARVMQALTQSGQLAGQMADQDFSQKSSAADIINKFNQANWANRQNISNQNVEARNAASLGNLQNAQGIANQNIMQRNEYDRFNQANRNDLQSRLADFRLQKAMGQSGALQSVAKGQDAQQQARMNVYQGLGSAAGSAFDYFGSKKKKPAVEE